MTEDLLTRARELAVYIIETRTTIRQAAKHFGLSKSTVHKDLAERLPAQVHIVLLSRNQIFSAAAQLPAANHALYAAVREILDENKAERHIRGGLATRKKYKGY
mgnify:CR=1 FL=1